MTTTFKHTYGEFDVAGSFNYFLKNNLFSAIPTWMQVQDGTVPPRTLNFDFPEQPLVFPSFAVTHLGSEDAPDGHWQGDRADGANKGIKQFGMCEIDCWVNSQDNFNWVRQLRDMRDMVTKLLRSQPARAIPLYDFTNPQSPSALTAVMRITNIRDEPGPAESNPAVKRRRILVSYNWVERF